MRRHIGLVILLALSLVGQGAYAQTSDVKTDVVRQKAEQKQQDEPRTIKAADRLKPPKRLTEVTVTGSLIPQTKIETATPVTTISADQMKSRSFGSVAEALQQSAFATGAAQGGQSSGGFTQGAETMSMFGLSPSYTKYLIDGRPMGNSPALYNGSNTFNSISGIPMALVDHIDILPGGQSSLYGSDAIAGVVNVVLKKKLDGPIVDVRYGWSSGGGGAGKRIALADSFKLGRLNVLGGVQFERNQPIWGYDRKRTRETFNHGATPQTASHDYYIYSAKESKYYFMDPDKCGRVANQWHGREMMASQQYGNYCGTKYGAGYRTLSSDSHTTNVYTHATFDVTDDFQLYSDFLYTYDEQKYMAGASYLWWGSNQDFGPIYDGRLNNGQGDVVNFQRVFTPEDLGGGGYPSIMNKNTDRSYYFTLGGKGDFSLGVTDWDYDIGFTHSEDQLTQRRLQRWKNAVDDYFQDTVLGPQLGMHDGYRSFEPDYPAFYKPIPASQMRSMIGYTDTQAKAWDNMLRGVLTNSSLFQLPGGDAGLALLAEGGSQGWNYVPDSRITNGDVWAMTDVSGHGHRSRYATTMEMALPVLKQVTVDLAGRYDSFNIPDQGRVSHPTWSVGLEFRPVETLLLRGKYGTAFKAPTLSDEFQGTSGYYSQVTDYYKCAQLNYTGANLGSCPDQYYNRNFYGTQSGNPKLRPITAKVWTAGVVWSPIHRLMISADYYHWSISNEVNQQSADVLSQESYFCAEGVLDAGSTSCQQVASQVTRDSLGNITSIYTPKVNVSKENLSAVVASLKYHQGLGRFGGLDFLLSYNDVLKHTQQQYPGDPSIDVFRQPYYQDYYDIGFKSKINGSITWSKAAWSMTLYGNRYGSTPNYRARQDNSYEMPGDGKLGSWFIANASLSYSGIRNLELSFMVNNLADKMPPLDRTYLGTNVTGAYNSDVYNAYGRRFYMEASYRF